MQTVALAKAIDGDVAALDIHREYLTQLESRAEAAGIADRIAILVGDMNAPPDRSPLHVAPVAPEYADDAAVVNGFEVLNACFDAALARMRNNFV